MPRCRNEVIGLTGALAFGLALIPAIAKPAPPESCDLPAAMADGWPVSSPRQQRLDPTLICAIGPHLEQLRAASPNGVVIIRHGVLVHEDYFSGEDQRWPQQHWKQPLPIMPHDAGTKHDVQSITKSVVALLVGIALDRGLIKTIDTPVLSFFPGYADLSGADRDRITLRDLLTMLWAKWSTEPYLDMARRMDAATDPYRFVLEQPMAATQIRGQYKMAARGRRWHLDMPRAIRSTNLPRGTIRALGIRTGNGNNAPELLRLPHFRCRNHRNSRSGLFDHGVILGDEGRSPPGLETYRAQG